MSKFHTGSCLKLNLSHSRYVFCDFAGKTLASRLPDQANLVHLYLPILKYCGLPYLPSFQVVSDYKFDSGICVWGNLLHQHGQLAGSRTQDSEVEA